MEPDQCPLLTRSDAAVADAAVVDAAVVDAEVTGTWGLAWQVWQRVLYRKYSYLMRRIRYLHSVDVSSSSDK